MNKKTLVLGASENPERYANKVTKLLLAKGHEVVLFGIKEGEIDGIKIENTWNYWSEIDTVTLYVGPQNQGPYIDLVLALKPKRVVFNPGTENEAFQEILMRNKIEAIEACTLVLLSINEY